MLRGLVVTGLSMVVLGLLGCTNPPGSGPDPDASVTYDGNLPSEFPLTIGAYWPAGADFAPLQTGQDVEIVQGIQGGVHTEIALEVDLGFDFADRGIIHLNVNIQTLLDGTDVVADLQLDGFPAGNMGLGVFRTQTLPVIFEQNEAVHYEGHDAVLLVQATLDDAESGHGVTVHLVDTRNDLE